MIESTLDSQLMKLGIHAQPLVSLISYVVVDEKDPAFQNPSKPIGPVYSEKEAASVPYNTHKTAKGYRRVVVSPKPITIVEKNEIKMKTLAEGISLKVYADEMQFEKAQVVKEKIVLLEKYQSKSTVVNPRIENVDVFSIITDDDHGYVNFIRVINGAIVQSHTVELKKQ